MKMLKVIIADDEERICRLIEALVDWEEIGMKVAGIAHNGIEAAEMVVQVEPDILITDIRMPGCSGLELIEQVKQQLPRLEIIIISGYAHFEYAQQAIKYGVGNYLLKPISKAELRATLKKLGDRISRRLEFEQDQQELIRKAERDDRQLRQNFITDLLEQKNSDFSAEGLWEKYGIRVENGVFQAFCLKLDSNQEELSESAESILMGKAQDVLERNFSDRCMEFVFAGKECYGFGVLHYEDGRQEEMRRVLKECLSQLEVRKNLLQPVEYSMSAGAPVSQPRELEESFKEAQKLVQERLLRGTGRLLERFAGASVQGENTLLDFYLRDITQAVELRGQEQAYAAAEALRQGISSAKEIRGYEILELIFSAGDVFAATARIAERSQCLARFRKKCGQCSSVEQLFICLKEFQQVYIQEMIDRHENETVRPVRRAKQYIQNHYSEQITLEEVSDEVGLSAAYFSVLFKKTEGEGFAKYLINVRVDQAKVLLRESNLPVTEICRRVGYNDLKHFTRTFEKATGVKPSTFRKLYG